MLNSRWFFLTALIVIGVFSRWIPHPGNFTALGATALLAGSVLRSNKAALLLPLLILFLSDLVLGFHSGMLIIYAAFLLTTWMGSWIPERNYFERSQAMKIFGFAISGSFVFYVLTNFAVWLNGTMYTHDTAGLIQCYVMGLPFLKNQILGDLFFSGVLFSSYEVLGRRWLLSPSNSNSFF